MFRFSHFLWFLGGKYYILVECFRWVETGEWRGLLYQVSSTSVVDDSCRTVLTDVYTTMNLFCDDQIAVSDAAERLGMTIPTFRRLLSAMTWRPTKDDLSPTNTTKLGYRQRLLLGLLDDEIHHELSRIHQRPLTVPKTNDEDIPGSTERDILCALQLITIEEGPFHWTYRSNLCSQPRLSFDD